MIRPPPLLPRGGTVPQRFHAAAAPGAPPGGMGLYVTPGRERKTGRILTAFACGVGLGCTLTGTEQPLPVRHHVVWGQIWTAEKLIPAVLARGPGQVVWQIDNGWVGSAYGGLAGHYRVTVNGPAPAFLPGAPGGRAAALVGPLPPWRADGRHVVVALPGPSFGAAWGLRMAPWIAGIEARVRAATARPVRVRAKGSDVPLAEDLRDAWALVTHSSNAAVQAVLAGVPAVVEASAATAPLGNVGLHWLARPELAGREPWLNSLLHQQWTLEEMRQGEAWPWLKMLAPEDAPTYNHTA